MIHFLYEIVLWFAALFFIPYHYVRSVQRKRPAAFAERFGMLASGEIAAIEGNGPIWVHAVSVGETIAAKPLIRALRERFPERRIVISNVTETGRRIALNIAEADLCLYFPFDFGFAVRRVLTTVRPCVILIVETEIWPNFLRAARKLDIPAVMVNGRISDRSFVRYLRLRWFFRTILPDFSWFCMQTDEDARRIVAMGAPPARVGITRNLKYDLPVADLPADKKEEILRAFSLPADLPLFTAGSTHQGEEEEVVAAYKQLLASGKKFLLILAPRHPERAAQVAELLQREKLPFARRTELNGRTDLFSPGEVLLVDTVGELMQIYAVSDVVFVGGSLVPTGGHNILEPASLRVPVLFGPHMGNFRESAELILSCGGGVQVHDGSELATVLSRLLDDPAERRIMGENGAGLLERNRGSTKLHLDIVERFLKVHR